MSDQVGIALPEMPAGIAYLFEVYEETNEWRLPKEEQFQLADDLCESLPTNWSRQVADWFRQVAMAMYLSQDKDMAKACADKVSIVGAQLSFIDGFSERGLWGDKVAYGEVENLVYALAENAGVEEVAAFGAGYKEFSCEFDAVKACAI